MGEIAEIKRVFKNDDDGKGRKVTMDELKDLGQEGRSDIAGLIEKEDV